MLLKSMVLAAFTFVSFLSFGQKIPLNTLIEKSKCTDKSCYEDNLNGFSLVASQPSKDGTTTYYIYNSDDFGYTFPNGLKTVNTANFYNFSIPGLKQSTASISTFDKLYYQTLLAGIKLKKFAKKTTVNIENTQGETGRGVKEIYQSTLYPSVEIYVYTYSEKQMDDFYHTRYGIEIKRTL